MYTQLSLSFVVSDWQLWAAPVAGLVSTGLTMYMGRLLTRSRTTIMEPPPIAANDWDPFTTGSDIEDERSAPRRVGNPVAVQLADGKATGHTFEGWVEDRSATGLGITAYQPVRPGAMLVVRPIKAPVGMAWQEIQVRNCTPQGGRWKLGCEFLRPPTWNILLLFG